MPEPAKTRRLSSGVIVCIGMFVLGLAMLVAFFRVPRGGSPAPAAEWGVPAERLRIISCRWRVRPDPQQLIAELRHAAPDYLLLQQISAADLDALAKALRLSTGDAGTVFYPVGDDTRGNAILATRPLYDGRSIPNPGGESFGVWASSIVDGRKFILASIDLAADPANPQGSNLREHDLTSLSRAWHALHDPPMIVGGEAGAALREATLARKPQPAQGDGFYLYGPWRITADGVVASERPEQRPPLWIEITHASP